MKKDYLYNVESILQEEKIENIKLENIDILKAVMNDNEISNLLYKNFKNNLPLGCEDIIMKTQDLVYRVNYCINNCLLEKQNSNNYELIKTTVKELIDKGADFYSAVSYDAFDKEMIDEFNFLLDGKDIGI